MLRSEIYLCSFDPTVGHEIKKTRPALIIQNDIGNRYSSLTVVAAITSTISTAPFPIEVVVNPTSANGLDVRSSIRLDQIRTADRQRLSGVWAYSIPPLWSRWMKRSRSAWG